MRPIMMRRMEQNLRTPGPTPIPQAVREAQAQPMIDHRGTEFAELLRETTAGLAELIGTRATSCSSPAPARAPSRPRSSTPCRPATGCWP